MQTIYYKYIQDVACKQHAKYDKTINTIYTIQKLQNDHLHLKSV